MEICPSWNTYSYCPSCSREDCGTDDGVGSNTVARLTDGDGPDARERKSTTELTTILDKKRVHPSSRTLLKANGIGRSEYIGNKLAACNPYCTADRQCESRPPRVSCGLPRKSADACQANIRPVLSHALRLSGLGQQQTSSIYLLGNSLFYPPGKLICTGKFHRPISKRQAEFSL
jgi:hypothetical protein